MIIHTVKHQLWLLDFCHLELLRTHRTGPERGGRHFHAQAVIYMMKLAGECVHLYLNSEPCAPTCWGQMVRWWMEATLDNDACHTFHFTSEQTFITDPPHHKHLFSLVLRHNCFISTWNTGCIWTFSSSIQTKHRSSSSGPSIWQRKRCHLLVTCHYTSCCPVWFFMVLISSQTSPE